MKRILHQLLVISSAVVLLDGVIVEVLHDGDLRGKLGPIDDARNRVCYDNVTGCTGGFARLVTFVKEMRKAATADRLMLYLNTGSVCGRTALFEALEPAAREALCVKVLKLLQPDVMTFTCGELENGWEPFNRIASKSNLSFVSSILFPEISNFYKNYKVIRKGALTVVVVGYMHWRKRVYLPLIYREFVPRTSFYFRKMAAEIKQLKPDIVIALSDTSHTFYKSEMPLLYGVDLVVSTGSERVPVQRKATPVSGNGVPLTRRPPRRYMERLLLADRVLHMAQTFGDGVAVGRVVCRVDEHRDGADTHLPDCEGVQVRLHAGIPEDKEAMTIYKQALAAVADSRHQVIGRSLVDLDGDTCAWDECNLGNVLADALTQCVARDYHGEGFTNVPISLLSASTLTRSIRPTDEKITLFDLLDAYKPAGNLTILVLTARDLLDTAELALDCSRNRGNGMLQVSGIMLIYKPDQVLGSKITKMMVSCTYCESTKFTSIESQLRYPVATTYLLSQGLDGHYVLRHSILKRNMRTVTDLECILEYFNSTAKLSTGIDGRIMKENEETYNTGTAVTLTIGCQLLSLIVGRANGYL